MARIVETKTHYQPKPPCRTAKEMTQLCCEPTAALQCCETVEPWDGYSDQEIIDRLGLKVDAKGRDQRGRYVRILRKERKRPCGEKRTIYDLSQNNCCDQVEPLSWDMDITPDVLPHGRSIIIAWQGSDGRQTEVRTSSNGTHFSDGRKTAIGHGNSIELFAGDTFCGATQVTVRDGCSEAAVIIRSDNGQWTAVSPFCAVSGVTAEVTGRSGNIIYGQGIGGAYKFLETVEATYINLPQILSTDCEEPNCPPYTQCCANCYGDLHCPSALEAIANEPAPCMRYERDQSFVSWLQYSETDGIDDPWVNKLMKHCNDRSSAIFVGTLVSNYCYNNQHRLAYLKQTALQTYQWTC